MSWIRQTSESIQRVAVDRHEADIGELQLTVSMASQNWKDALTRLQLVERFKTKPSTTLGTSSRLV